MSSSCVEARDGRGARDDELPVQNPATGEEIARVRRLSAGDVAERAARARAAQPAWRDSGFAFRAKVLRNAQRWLLAEQRRFAQTIISETGKTYEDAQLEISVAAQSFGFWAKKAEGYLADERVSGGGPLLLGRRVVVRYEPLGLVGVIGPRNYPLVNLFCDCVPALMAGNAVLAKPSEVTPLTALLTAEMMRESGMPTSVLEMVTGDGETGGALVDEADYVMFTGSATTGQEVMERAARSMTQVSLELGGKDPMIVLADANLERAANAATYYAMNNAGQVCMSVERVYVEAPVYDEFVAKVVAKVGGLRQGGSDQPGQVEVGAVTFAPQCEIIESHIRDAVEKGATVLTGGSRGRGPGDFFQPTVLTGVDHSMKAITDETFGPTMPIMKVADAEEAVRMANDSVSAWVTKLMGRFVRLLYGRGGRQRPGQRGGKRPAARGRGS